MKNKTAKTLCLLLLLTFILSLPACNIHRHDWGEWVTTVPATCLDSGLETRTCKINPSHIITRYTAMLGHDWNDWIETWDGTKIRTCKNDHAHTETYTETHEEIPFKETEGLLFTLIDKDVAYSVSAEAAKGEKEIFIPALHQGKPVTDIAAAGFLRCPNLESVTFEKNNQLKTIGLSAFSVCKNLKSITIPQNVAALSSTFDECSRLASVTFAKGSLLETIGEYTFSKCESLKKIVLPQNLKSIDGYAFNACISLESIVIPVSVKSIGINSFSSCASLTKVFYGGASSADWDRIDIDKLNTPLFNAACYYYSEIQPASNPQNFWRFVEGVPIIWN